MKTVNAVFTEVTVVIGLIAIDFNSYTFPIMASDIPEVVEAGVSMFKEDIERFKADRISIEELFTIYPYASTIRPVIDNGKIKSAECSALTYSVNSYMDPEQYDTPKVQYGRGTGIALKHLLVPALFLTVALIWLWIYLRP